MLRSKSIVDLPVRPSLTAGDIVEPAYLKDRDAVHTVEQLQTFVAKWKNIWLLKFNEENGKLEEGEESLVADTYEPATVLQCLDKLRAGVCKHVGNGPSCAGMHIMLPLVLLRSAFLAKHYGVSVDTVLIQLSAQFFPETAERLF